MACCGYMGWHPKPILLGHKLVQLDDVLNEAFDVLNVC
jgi:hypothetical protein